MLRFRLGSIPIEVHPSHLLLVAGLAVSAGGNVSTLDLSTVIVWMALISFSVLFHELGHALVSRAFGYRPAIQLAWLGGNTRPNAPGPIPWWRDVLLTLAGPLFGCALGVASFAARGLAAGHPGVQNLLLGLGLTNFYWAGLNLLPILPMDGGRVLYAVLTRMLGGRGALVSWGVSALLAAAAALFAVSLQQTWVALLAAMFALQAGRAFLELKKGQSAAGDPPALVEARAAFARGDLAEAWRKACWLSEQELSPAVRSRTEHLLGWIALKEGKGRLALDHFSLVSRQRVEREALAAAFSLLGDDARALPLWQLAYQESPGPTVLHELAGTLLRLGHFQALARLPGVDAATAYGCAERVYFLRGQFREAALAGAEAFRLHPLPQRAYDVACAWSRAGLPAEAMGWLERAKAAGLSDTSRALSDPDLASLHGRPEFQAWAAAPVQSHGS